MSCSSINQHIVSYLQNIEVVSSISPEAQSDKQEIDVLPYKTQMNSGIGFIETINLEVAA